MYWKKKCNGRKCVLEEKVYWKKKCNGRKSVLEEIVYWGKNTMIEIAYWEKLVTERNDVLREKCTLIKCRNLQRCLHKFTQKVL